MELIDSIKTRRSIRIFKEDEISEEALHTIFEAARWSPSWANTQCWEIIVIREKSAKEKLQQAIFEKNPAYRSVVQAPIVLMLCAKLNISGSYNKMVTTKFGDWFMFDLGILTQTIVLTAHSFGLGSVIIGLFDHDRVRRDFAVPQEYEVVSLLPIGVPAKIPNPPKRKEIQDFVHFEHF
ncbi:MAG: nitroreductase family protein [Desulfobacterales bacterium]|nr:nitroreductase family protein [Desulfobacterales bacterium]